jgi:hypothetical protein
VWCRVDAAELAYEEALAIYRKLNESEPSHSCSEVVATLGSLVGLERLTNQGKIAIAHIFEAERLLDPLWRTNPIKHGDEMARILVMRAQACADHG